MLTPAAVPAIERASYVGAYKGVTDLLTKYLWPEWALAITRATEIQRARRAEKDDYIAAFDHEWRRWSYGRDGKQFVSRPADWEATIARHFDASLDIDALTQLVRDVITRATHPSYATAPKGYVRDEDMWRYFCGALRNHMRERSELATELLAERVT